MTDLWRELLAKGSVGQSMLSANLPVSPPNVPTALLEIRAPYAYPFTITLFQDDAIIRGMGGSGRYGAIAPFVNNPTPPGSPTAFCRVEWGSGGTGPAIAEITVDRGRIFCVHGEFIRLAMARDDPDNPPLGNGRVGAFVSLGQSSYSGEVQRHFQIGNAAALAVRRAPVPPLAINFQVKRRANFVLATDPQQTSVDIRIINGSNAIIDVERLGINVPHEIRRLPQDSRVIEILNNDPVFLATSLEVIYGLAL